MRIISITAILLVLCSIEMKAQQFESMLNGFMLEQFRETTYNSLGKAHKSVRFEDGWEYDVFYLNRDSSTYMVFEYSEDRPGSIWSIQISGEKTDYAVLNGIKLGDKLGKLKRKLGKPDSLIELQSGKIQRYEYFSANYTLEVREGRLFSIKIMNVQQHFFGNYNLEELIGFDAMMEVISSLDREKIGEILSPDIEMYEDTNIYFFHYSFATEIAADSSGVFARILDFDHGFRQLARDGDYQLSMRLSKDKTPLYVMKFGLYSPVIEIVWKYQFGGYRIWEVRFR